MKEIASLFKSLEDETRLRIMGLLLDAGELCVCHIMEVLRLPQSTVSRHLSTLKNAGWLKDRRAGIWIHYSIAMDLSAIHRPIITALRTTLEQNATARMDRKRLASLDVTTCCT
jgi:ArsR family transcriptional regulator